MFCSNSGLSGDHYARRPSNNLSQTAFELWKPKENSGRQQLSGAPHATHAKSVDKDVRRELGCTPTVERINTDYDPGSVVSTAQSNQPAGCLKCLISAFAFTHKCHWIGLMNSPSYPRSTRLQNRCKTVFRSVHYSSSCTPLLSVPSFPLVP